MSWRKATAEAAREAAEAVGAISTRREFTISKFDRHPEGYLHARVVVRGTPYYFHRRYGSWLAPGHIGGHAVLKEPEGLLGTVMGREVKYALSEKSAPYDNADRKQREAAAEAAKRRTNARPDKPDGSDQADGDHRVRHPEHNESADEDLRHD